jgi:HSP20 family protein
MFGLLPRTKRPMALLPRMETPFSWFPEEFGNLFNRFLIEWPTLEMPEWPLTWGVTTEEKEKEFVVRVEAPGFEPAEIKVDLLGERLTIEAEHKEPAEKGKEEAKRVYAHVKRVITLPPGVELEKAEAAYRNGVLEVRVPRKPEVMGRRIEVKT